MISKVKCTYEDKSSRTFNNVNPASADEDVKAVAELLNTLVAKTPAKISRIDEKVLSEVVTA